MTVEEAWVRFITATITNSGWSDWTTDGRRSTDREIAPAMAEKADLLLVEYRKRFGTKDPYRG